MFVNTCTESTCAWNCVFKTMLNYPLGVTLALLQLLNLIEHKADLVIWNFDGSLKCLPFRLHFLRNTTAFGIPEQSRVRLDWQNSVVLTNLFLLIYLASEGLKAVLKKGLWALLTLASLESIKLRHKLSEYVSSSNRYRFSQVP